MVLPWMLAAPAEQTPPVYRLPAALQRRAPQDGQVTIATWNLAHGRGRTAHQGLRPPLRIRRELDRIAAVLRREQVDLAAFQEVDGRSWWNAGIDMTRHVGRAAGFRSITRGDQVATWGLRYGTALATTTLLGDARSLAFRPGFYAPGKGVTWARWRIDAQRQATVASVHLHFAPGPRRRREAALLVAALQDAPRPLILCGDFNGGWRRGRGVVASIAEALDLQAYDCSGIMPTMFGRQARFDWIMASPPLRLLDCWTLPDVHSDHRAVIARIGWPHD